MHCLAGDATGIIVAASIVPTSALANGWDVLIECPVAVPCSCLRANNLR